MKYTLFLGSKSQPRRMLLQEVGIPFQCVGQDADETLCNWSLPLEQVVREIALFKMEHTVLPPKEEHDICFVLTADTLSQDKDGTIHGKPVDRDDAMRKIRSARAGSRLSTAFCVDRRRWKDGAWHTEERLVKVVTSEYLFDIPDEYIEWYINTSTGLACSNAIAVEGIGGLFLKEVRGSYSNIIGLPLFELREALAQLGFFAS